jgi:hypothetical protein
MTGFDPERTRNCTVSGLRFETERLATKRARPLDRSRIRMAERFPHIDQRSAASAGSSRA